jgi:hypothetical protein
MVLLNSNNKKRGKLYSSPCIGTFRKSWTAHLETNSHSLCRNMVARIPNMASMAGSGRNVGGLDYRARRSFTGYGKGATRRLAEAGCSAKVIAAITGHKSLREIERYAAAADQFRLARMAIESIS